MTRDEIKEIYEAIAVAMNILEDEGEDLYPESADYLQGRELQIRGEAFTIRHKDAFGENRWVVKANT